MGISTILLGPEVQNARLDILGNDNLGTTGTITEFGILTNPTMGTLSINDNGTPADDDFVNYRANGGASGLRLLHLLIAEDKCASQYRWRRSLRTQRFKVAYDFALVDTNGNPISDIGVGDQFGVQVIAEDLQSFLESHALAGYLDLHDADKIQPA